MNEFWRQIKSTIHKQTGCCGDSQGQGVSATDAYVKKKGAPQISTLTWQLHRAHG